MHLAMLQTKDLLYVLDLRIVRDLCCAGVPHVEELAPQGKHAVFVTPNHAEPADRQCLG